MLSILVQGARAGKRNRKSSNSVCVNKKEGQADSKLLSQSGEEEKEPQSKKSQVELHWVLHWAKHGRRHGCEQRALTLQCQQCCTEQGLVCLCS